MSLRTLTTTRRRSRAAMATAAVIAALTVTACSGGNTGAAGSSPDTGSSPNTASSTTTTGPTGSATTAPTGSATVSPTPTHNGGTGRQHGDQVSVLDTLPGSRSSGCVAVRDQTTVRSGTLAMGNFQQARQQFRSGQVGGNSLYFYVIPGHAGSMPGATVTAKHPGSRTATFASTSASSANEWKYYPVTVTVNAPGTWTLTVTAGQDNGCFVVRF